MTNVIDLRHIRAKAHALELLTTEEIEPATFFVLKLFGIDADSILDLCGPIVRRLATFDGAGSFVWDPLGEVSLAVIAYDETGENELDIVAWSARAPWIFGTLLHQASLLGAHNVVNPATYHGDRPCRLWSMPLNWLAAGCEGAVVLNPIPAGVILAKAPGPLAAEDIQHARQIINTTGINADRLKVPARRRVA